MEGRDGRRIGLELRVKEEKEKGKLGRKGRKRKGA